jgi:hypothetical protein
VDRWITANVSSCIDFYGIDKLINTEVAIITIAAIGIIGLLMRNSLLNKIAASYTKRKYATINGFKQQENLNNFRVVTTHKKRMIQVNNLSKKYNGTTVLNIENLEIPKDKVWVLWEITVPVKQPFSLLLI